MHVNQPPRARALVQIVDILRDQQQFARPFGIESGERAMRVVGLGRGRRDAARIVEAMDLLGIALERLRRAHVFDAVALP